MTEDGDERNPSSMDPMQELEALDMAGPKHQ